MITVKVVLDTRSIKKDNTSPLKLRLLYNRKSNQISLGYSILEKDWDARKERIKPSCKAVNNVNRINSIILKKKQKAFDILTQIEAEGKLDILSFKEIKALLTNQHTDLMALEFGRKIIDQLKQSGKYGNARVYQMMLNSISNFQKGKDFPMKKITFSWLKKYEAWFLSKGNTENGLGVNMRTLRALCNRAIKRNLISADFYPFKDYKIKSKPTRKRAITLEDVQKLKEFTPTTKRQERAKNYFFISFYLMGASFIDMAYLKLGNIHNNRIEYKRRKTGRLYNIPISEPLKALINKYTDGKSKKDFLLNIIKSSNPEKQLKEARHELSRYNKTLKKIGKLCDIEANLTSYVARHSYATIAKYKGVPTAIISEALGHSSEEVTQIYLDSFKKEVLDKYHQLIIE